MIGLDRVASTPIPYSNSRLGMLSEMPASFGLTQDVVRRQTSAREGLVKEYSHVKHRIYIDVGWGIILLLEVMYSKLVVSIHL
jgi:hypothetical protein